jgi:hypothetical protein
MLKSILVSAAFGVAVVVACATPVFGQTPKVEASVFGGWVFSDGVSGQNVLAGDGKLYNRVDPKDSGSFGFSISGYGSHDVEYGFMYGRQFSRLVISGQDERDLGSLATMNYHGYVSVVFGDSHAKVRPFALGGAGVTHFGEVTTTTVAGVTRVIGGQTQFSTKWGAGVKIFPSPRVGLRVAFSWVPTYIKSDPGGWWCDPYWGCYSVGSSQYSNQFEFSGGVTFRLGGGK